MAYLRLVAVNVAVLASILIVIEGAAGYGSFVRGYLFEPDLAERRHTRYDPLLGWSNVSSANVPNMYGPGVFLRINSQGFRNDRDFSRDVPSGRIRIICSGDSYTLGYGVDNDHAWCQQLTALDPRLETVNMGQGGYGLGQIYLWYERDGGSLAHQVQILALITDDVARMAESEFGGYGMPMLFVEHDALVVKGVPVPGPASPHVRRVMEQSRRLRSIGAVRRMREWLGLDTSANRLRHGNVDETREVATRVLADLKRLNDERSSTLILVHLPIEDDIRQRDREDGARFIERAARELGIAYIPLMDAFTALPPPAMSGMFIKEGELDYPGSEGHYTAAGNEFVARLIHKSISHILPDPGK